MRNQFLVFSFSFLEKCTERCSRGLKTKNAPARRSLAVPDRSLARRRGAGGKLKTSSGFTLVETLAAVILLTISITAPMLLTVKSLSSAYYARDQYTASYLAQEAIEAVHQIRDNQILALALGTSGSYDLFGYLPIASSCSDTPTYFTVDARKTMADQVVANANCGTTADSCPVLQDIAGLYGYGSGTAINFKRSVSACYIDAGHNEVQISVTVKWKTAALAERTFTISENLYRWIQDGSGT